MGESDRYSDYKIKNQRISFGQPNNALMWLFVFNVVFFLVLLTIKTSIEVNDNSSLAFYTNVAPWFQLPADIVKLTTRPWTLIVYMFSEVDLFRTISNMLWLWAFGTVLQNLTGNKKIIPVYLYGGFIAALFFIVASNLIPSNRILTDTMGLIGANASIMAIAAAATYIAPNYRFFRHIRNGIPLWVFTIIYFAIDLASVADTPAAVPIAHIGGAIAGLVFVYLLNKNFDAGAWMNLLYSRTINLFNPDKQKKQNRIKEKVFYDTGIRSPYTKSSNITQQRIDEILDKINLKGYNQLTKEEKEILKKVSEQ